MRFIVDALNQFLHCCMWNQLNLRKVKPLIGKGLKLLVNKYAVPFSLRFSLKRQCYEISKAALRNGGLRGQHPVKSFKGDCLVERRCFGDKAASKFSCDLCAGEL